jgi:AcrR family transcriptional regulator
MTPTRKGARAAAARAAAAPAAAPARAYHHGDLRRALVASALELLRTEGVQALTLRAVARAAGVSQAAPYRHFADRRALVAAVAEEGFRQLGDAMMQAMAASADMRLAFREVGLAYVRFALEHPAEYRVMFGAEVANHADLPALRAQSRGVLDGVARAVAGLQKGGLVGPGDPHTMAAALWATLHGLVMLSLDGQTTGVVASHDALVDEALRLVMFGMAPRA